MPALEIIRFADVWNSCIRERNTDQGYETNNASRRIQRLGYISDTFMLVDVTLPNALRQSHAHESDHLQCLFSKQLGLSL
jgi:hypothetical protein